MSEPTDNDFASDFCDDLTSITEIRRNTLCLKVSVSTLSGYLKGVPELLQLFDKLQIKASFYFSFGPDNSGKSFFKILPTFFKKKLRKDTLATYGFKSLFYGTLLPAPMIVSQNPKNLMSTFKKGHECGIEAWDHVKWRYGLAKLSELEIKTEILKAENLFRDILKQRPLTFSSPGRQISLPLLNVLDSMPFDYVSNTKGPRPTLIDFKGKSFKTLEIPTTMPTLKEQYSQKGIDDSNIVDHLLSHLKDGINIQTVYAELEGRTKIHLFETFLQRAMQKGYKIITMNELRRSITKVTRTKLQ